MAKLDKVFRVDTTNSELFIEVNLEGLNKNSKIVVQPTHTAFLVKDGVIVETFENGTYDLCEKTKGVWIFKHKVKDYSTAKLLYISKTAKVPVYWGTNRQTKIEYIDQKLGYPIRLKAAGSMEVRVLDPKKFYLEIVAGFGNDTVADRTTEIDASTEIRAKGGAVQVAIYNTEKFQNRFRPKALSIISDKIREKIVSDGISFFDLDNAKTTIQESIYDSLNGAFSNYYGIEVCDFLIESFEIDESEKEELIQQYKNKKAREDRINKALEDKEDELIIHRANRAYEQERMKDSEDDTRRALAFKRSILDDEDAIYENKKRKERDEAEYLLKIKREEEDRQWARERKLKEDEKDITLNKIYHDSVKTMGWEHSPANKKEQQSAKFFCTRCGSEVNKDDLFCGNCGEPTAINNLKEACPNCGREISIKVKFCPSCGAKLKEDKETTKKTAKKS